MPIKTAAREVAEEACRRQPHQPSRTIARQLHEEHWQLFESVEKARTVVRYCRGRIGARHRRENKDIIPGEEFSQADGAIPLPPPVTSETWSVVPVEFKQALVISDIHVPYHNAEAVQTALQYGRKRKPDAIILNGDLADFQSISFFERDPRRRHLRDELETCERFLEVLRDAFPRARILYKEGNHEERLWRYCWRNVPELADLEELSLGELLHLKDYGVELVADKRPIRCGEHLYLLHGHEFRAPFVNPVNPARGLYLRTKANALCGDLHQTSAHTEAGLDKIVSCWSAGCLCDLHPRYMPLNKWNLGFAFVTLDRNRWSVENLKIIAGKVV